LFIYVTKNYCEYTIRWCNTHTHTGTHIKWPFAALFNFNFSTQYSSDLPCGHDEYGQHSTQPGSITSHAIAAIRYGCEPETITNLTEFEFNIEETVAMQYLVR
jgi:hypothetical protein